MVGTSSGGAYTSNNALLALWLEVGDGAYVAKWYILLVDQRNGIAGLDADAYGADHTWCMIVIDNYHGLV